MNILIQEQRLLFIQVSTIRKFIFIITILKKNTTFKLIHYITLIISFIFVILPFSKIGFISLPLFLGYYLIYLKRKLILTSLFIIGLVILYISYNLGKSGNYGGSIFHLIFYFIDTIYQNGLFDAIFKTRYSTESGLLSLIISILSNIILEDSLFL